MMGVWHAMVISYVIGFVFGAFAIFVLLGGY